MTLPKNVVIFENYSKYKMVCSECNIEGIKSKEFSEERQYYEHYIDKHFKNKNKNNKLSCPHCDKESTSWHNFFAHVTIHREQEQRPWICAIPKTAHSRNSTGHKKG
eukprot:33904_1